MIIAMKTLTVARISSLPDKAALVPVVLDELNVSFVSVDTVNWRDDYPYCPEVAFRMAWCPEGIVLHYRVSEQSVRAKYVNDGEKVWTDSCVECFIRNEENNVYYNIECNCIGTLLVGLGDGRHQRRLVPLDALESVLRWASLGNEPFEERIGNTMWEVALVIPRTVFASHPLRLMPDASLRANFYKCGDELKVPHFATWNAIDTPSPDYHRPECFGVLRLADSFTG